MRTNRREMAKKDDFHHRTDIPVRSGVVVRPKDYKHTLYGQQEGHCTGCRTHFDFRHFHVDHIIPRSQGAEQTPKATSSSSAAHATPSKATERWLTFAPA